MSSFMPISIIIDRMNKNQEDRDLVCVALNDLYSELTKIIRSNPAANINNANALKLSASATTNALPNYSIYPFEVNSEQRLFNILQQQLFETNISEIHELVIKVLPLTLLCSHTQTILQAVTVCIKNLVNSAAATSNIALQNSFDDYERETAELQVAKRAKAINLLQCIIENIPKQNEDVVNNVLKYVLPNIIQNLQQEMKAANSGAAYKKAVESKKNTATVHDISAEHAILDYMNIIHSCIINHGDSLKSFHTNLLDLIQALLVSPSKLVVKQAVISVSTLTPLLSNELFQSFLGKILQLFPNNEFAVFQLLAALIQHNYSRFSALHLHQIVKLCVDFSNNKQSHVESANDLREAALLALDSAVRYTSVVTLGDCAVILPCLQAALHYDPNFVGDEEEDDEKDNASMEEDEDEDRNDEGAGEDEISAAGSDAEAEDLGDDYDEAAEDDDDDSSWKVRRAASKCINAILTSLSSLFVSQSSGSATAQSKDPMSPSLPLQPNFTRYLELIRATLSDLIPILQSKLLERTDHIRIEILKSYIQLLNFPPDIIPTPQIQMKSILKLLKNVADPMFRFTGTNLQVKETAYQLLAAIANVLTGSSELDHLDQIIQQIIKFLNNKVFQSNSSHLHQLSSNIFLAVRALIAKADKASFLASVDTLIAAITNKTTNESLLLAASLAEVLDSSSPAKLDSSISLWINRVQSPEFIKAVISHPKQADLTSKAAYKLLNVAYRNTMAVINSTDAKYDRIAKSLALDCLGSVLSFIPFNSDIISPSDFLSLLSTLLDNQMLRTAAAQCLARVIPSLPLTASSDQVLYALSHIAQFSAEFLKQVDRSLQRNSLGCLNNISLVIIEGSHNGQQIQANAKFTKVAVALSALLAQSNEELLLNEGVLITLAHVLLVVLTNSASSNTKILETNTLPLLMKSSNFLVARVFAVYSSYNTSTNSQLIQQLQTVFSSSNNSNQQTVLAVSAAYILVAEQATTIVPLLQLAKSAQFGSAAAQFIENKAQQLLAKGNDTLKPAAERGFSLLVAAELLSLISPSAENAKSIINLMNSADSIVSRSAAKGLAGLFATQPENQSQLLSALQQMESAAPVTTVAELFRRAVEGHRNSAVNGETVQQLLAVAVDKCSIEFKESDSDFDLATGALANSISYSFILFPETTAQFIQSAAIKANPDVQIAILRGSQAAISHHFHKQNSQFNEAFRILLQLLIESDGALLSHIQLSVQTAAVQLVRAVTAHEARILSDFLPSVLTRLNDLCSKQEIYIQSVKYGPVTKQIDTAAPVRLQIYLLLQNIFSEINEILFYSQANQANQFQAQLTQQLVQIIDKGLKDDYDCQLVIHKLSITLINTFHLQGAEWEQLISSLINNLNQAAPVETVRQELERYEEVIHSALKTAKHVEKFIHMNPAESVQISDHPILKQLNCVLVAQQQKLSSQAINATA
jgi:prepilin signal peptidase PulO-like enzyme (type II secretory pathway)